MFPIQPASAIFGLSTCEKVKKEILQKEKAVDSMIRYYNNRFGGRDVGINNRIWKNGEKKEAHEKFLQFWGNYLSLYTIGRNNPKCFTITQRDEIATQYKLSKSMVYKWKDINWFHSQWNYPILSPLPSIFTTYVII